MFKPRQNRNFFQAAWTTLALIYHMTVYKLRKRHRSPVWGLVMSIAQAAIMVLIFYLGYFIFGVRHSPIRGDFILFIMSGIFIYLTHAQAMGAVAGAENAINPMMKHEPLNTAIAIMSSALAVLYNQTLSAFAMLFIYITFIGNISIEDPYACYGIFLLAWFSGVCVGLVCLAARPWWPQGMGVVTSLYQRANMIASGKMFVANTLPGFLLPIFDWNPLFHIIDQGRGQAFINYTPHHSNLSYPIRVSLALLMVGLMGEFVTRRHISLSWVAGK